jgi:DNA polymerase III delta prime subunit
MSTVNSWWPEKHRPSTIDQYVGNPDFVNKVKHWIETGDVPNLILYSEKSGTGKTTCCKIIARALDADVLHINAAAENSIDVVREKIISFAMSAGFSQWKIVILDEFSHFTPYAQEALLNVIEVSSTHTRFFLTGNHIQKFLPAIKSRCTPFIIQSPPVADVCKNIASVLKAENVEYDNETVVKVVRQFYPDQRSMLNYCQANSITGRLTFDSAQVVSVDYCSKVGDVIKNCTTAQDGYVQIRKIFAEDKVKEFDDMFRYLFDNVEILIPAGKRSWVLIAIAEAQFRSVQVMDKEIQAIAMILNILKEIK